MAEMAVAAESPAICVPMNVDAFILNPAVCNEGLVRIAPITQPDYRGLRLNSQELQHDLLPHVDLDRCQPGATNPRISAIELTNTPPVNPSQPQNDKLGTPPVREGRIGVHIHWSLPRMFRAATSASNTTTKLPTGELVNSSPTFRVVPNRWIVFRKVISSTPKDPQINPDKPNSNITGAWLVESDRLWRMAELMPNVDLESDVSPFVSYNKGDEKLQDVFDRQASIFLGEKITAIPTPTGGITERGDTVPRFPGLTTMNSSNISFADNTDHNTNVFSMIDDMSFYDGSGVRSQYTEAVCNYTVIGWQSKEQDDPIGTGGPKEKPLKDRLKALFCEIGDRWLARLATSLAPFRLIFYGTITQVSYSRSVKPLTPSENFARMFTSSAQMEPVSVSTTPLDSVLTFLQAHNTNEDDIFGSGASAIAKNILALRELLSATEDTYNSRVKASDLIYANNFAPVSAGQGWHWNRRSQHGQPASIPDDTRIYSEGLTQLRALIKLNDLQLQLEAARRKLQSIQWGMFSVWWKWISEDNKSDAAVKALYSSQVVELRNSAARLTQLINTPVTGLLERIGRIIAPRPIVAPSSPVGLALPVFRRRLPVTQVSFPFFHQRKDPTICIAGMDSGWPSEYTGTTKVYYAYALPSWDPQEPPQMPQEYKLSSPIISEKGLLDALTILIRYAVLDNSDRSTLPGFKKWSGQPWSPLYIEWEAVYFHIPFDKWSVQIMNSPVGNNHDQVRYGLRTPLFNDPQNGADQRTVAGRIILTPQPTVNLQALVAQVLDMAGVAQPSGMTTDELVDKVGKLKLLSSELSGLTNNLLTVGEGSHVQPNLQIPGMTDSIPFAAAVTAVSDISMTADDIKLIGNESGFTPYADLVDFSQAKQQPFKPVTHGQFRFTKLNIIDKFGQVISGIQPTPELKNNPLPSESLHPCLGDQVCPGLIPGTTQLNTITPLTDADPHLPGGYPLCPYIQLTPAINQASRLNASFVTKQVLPSGLFDGWTVASEWEQPVWAWIVVNYADYGIQFFTADGTFYVEMSLGGPTGSIQSTLWLPFDPPKNPPSNVSPQLVQLIDKMNGPGGSVYLRSFWDMINKAVEHMPYAPADYAAYASAIVGKPLALVNAGFSLELAIPPLRTQTTRPPTLAPADKELLSYEFPVKIGDAYRPFDGVVGYFDADNTTSGETTWDKLFTYFTAKTTVVPAPNPPQPQQGDPRVLIEPTTFPVLKPFYIDPDGPLVKDSFAASLAQKMLVKTLLIDPYTPLHLYSPILPIVSLQLPSWTVQSALQKMSAFFKLGPCLLSRDVPISYDSLSPISADTWTKKQQELQTKDSTAPIRLPLLTGKKGMWNWLQPYVTDADGDGKAEETRYNAFEVGVEDGRLRLDPGPYTMVEGFLQLAQPINNPTM